MVTERVLRGHAGGTEGGRMAGVWNAYAGRTGGTGTRRSSTPWGGRRAWRLSAALAALAMVITVLPEGWAVAEEEPPPAETSAYTGTDAVEPDPAEPDDVAVSNLSVTSTCGGDEPVAVLQTNVPWFSPWGLHPLGANVHELEAAGVDHCLLSPSELGSVSLAGFEQIVISAAQSQAFYDALFPGGVVHTALSDWVADGGLLKANLTDCASGPGNGGTWATRWCGANASTSYEFVGGVKHVSDTHDRNSLASRRHPILTAEVDCPSGNCGPLINVGAREDLNAWNWSSHGYFIDLPRGSTILVGQPDTTGDLREQPVAVDYPHGDGRVIATLTTTEWRYGGNNSGFENRKLLANLLAYSGERVTNDRGPYPLLGAHGITGVAEDMDNVLDFATTMVPLLPLVQSAQTGEITSVWTNGDQITREAAQILSDTGARHVNLIAHSKGGLDSRAAMWRHWELFSDLGMLGTPNGGAQGADRLCFLRRRGIDGASKSMGPCRDANDGLFNLQTSYMQEVFNKEVRDWGTHTHYVVAADCTKLFSPRLCNAANGLLMGGLMGCDLGGDKVVCVESAFDRARGYGNGIHYALEPVFDLDHTGVRESACTNSRVLAPMYGRHNFGNPWIGGDGSGCEELPYGGVGGFATATATATAEAGAGEAAFVDQAVAIATGQAGQPLTIGLDPEGGDAMRVGVFTPSSIDVEVTTDDGREPEVIVEELDLVGERVHVLDVSGLEGAPATLRITPATSHAVAVITQVTPADLDLQVEVTAAGPLAEVEVVLTGAHGVDHTVTATAEGRDTTLSQVSSDADELRFRGALSVRRGDLVPIDIVLDGPQRRFVSTGVVLDEGSGEIGELVGEHLVDLTGDGTPDEWRLEVSVDVGRSDSYHLNLDLETGDGERVMSAPGRAALDAGPGLIEVVVPLPALLGAGSEGPFDLAEVTLSRGDGAPIRVATADWIGRTGTLDLGDVTPDELLLSAPEVRTLDRSGDGRLDLLAFDTRVWAPRAGAHRVEALLLGPDGDEVAVHDVELALDQGGNAVRIGFDGDVVVDNGSGVYSLLDLRVTSTETGALVRWPLVLTPPLDADDWDTPVDAPSPSAGSLLERWVAAWEQEAIGNHGHFAAQRHRLSRIVELSADGYVERALAELDRFVEQVEHHTPRFVDPAVSEDIRAHAALVRSGLAG
jgi:hypothetical protein